SEPSTTAAPAPAPVVPSCRDALATAPVQPTAPPDKGSGDAAGAAPESRGAADAAKQAKAANAEAANQQATGFRGAKGLGTVVSVADGAITIAIEAQPEAPSQITATVRPDADFMDGNERVTAQPTVNAGDRVAFGAVQADDGSYQIIYLGVHLPDVQP